MKKAVAMQYDGERNFSPKLTALGKGLVADNIIKKAHENDVPIIEDTSLVELLSELNINEVIPDELYEAVAEVFAFVYQVDQRADKDKKWK